MKKVTFQPTKRISTYNYTTNRDSSIDASDVLVHVDTTDKGDIFLVVRTNEEHSVDRADAKSIVRVK